MNGARVRGGRADAHQVEECCYRFLKIGGALMLLGFILMLTTVLFWLGAPMVAAGGAIVVGNIVWFLRLKQREGIMVACPHCEKEYNVLPGFHSFTCDECKHVVPVPQAV